MKECSRDIDFRSTIDRATFEAKAEKTFPTNVGTVAKVGDGGVCRNLGLTLEDVEAIEVIGGTVRVPTLQRLIDEEVFEGYWQVYR